MTTDATEVIAGYFEALTAGDTGRILNLFAPGAHVYSPFLGVMPATEFYAKLDAASAQSVLTVLDVLMGQDGQTAAARFQYDWTLRSGDKILFEGVDHFTFDAARRIVDMRIYYDTHPVRADVGDKYG